MKKKPTYKRPNKSNQKKKRREKTDARIFIGLLIAFTLYHVLITPKTLGDDIRYPLFVFAIPIVLGLFILGYWRRNFLIQQFVSNKGIVIWTFLTLFYLMQGFFISLVSFGLVAKITWDIAHTQISKQNRKDVFDCNITEFRSGNGPNIEFQFNGKAESIRARNSTMQDLKDLDVNDYFIRIEATEGLWNYYTLEEWSIEQK